MPKYKVRAVNETISTHKDYTVSAEDEAEAEELVVEILSDKDDDDNWEITEVIRIGD